MLRSQVTEEPAWDVVTQRVSFLLAPPPVFRLPQLMEVDEARGVCVAIIQRSFEVHEFPVYFQPDLVRSCHRSGHGEHAGLRQG